MRYSKYEWLTYPDVSKYPSSDKIFLDNISYVNYIDTIFRKQNICTIKLNEINEYFVNINISDLTFNVSEKLVNYLHKCKENTKIQFYIIPIALIFPNTFESNDISVTTSAHSNVVIIDTKNGVIEFFEPHGIYYKGNSVIYNTELIIQTVISQILPLFSPKNNTNYIFENVYSSCPYFGIQTTDSYCLAWSLFYTELRILNADHTSQDIINILSGWEQSFRLEYIKRYISYIQDNSVYKKNMIYNSVQQRKIGELVFDHLSSPFNPSFLFNPLKIDNVIIKETLINRINVLLNEYKKLNDNIKTSEFLNVDPNFVFTLKQKLKVVFNELTSYQDYPDFSDYLLQFFKNI
jgi:hypothetical protein